MLWVLRLRTLGMGAAVHRVVHKCTTARPLRQPSKRVTQATVRNNDEL